MWVRSRARRELEYKSQGLETQRRSKSAEQAREDLSARKYFRAVAKRVPRDKVEQGGGLGRQRVTLGNGSIYRDLKGGPEETAAGWRG